MNTSLRNNIDWVGYVDWNVRDFHGYETRRGSTYNAYLVRDGKNALIDTVKAGFGKQLLDNVRRLIDLRKIDYIVCNHAELDHAGSLPEVVAACPQAEIVCDDKCQKALALHHDITGWKFKIVKDGDKLSLGKRTLVFVETPMAHWPESMATYVPEEKILFSMDGFGQHYASSGRFDDEEPLNTVMFEAKTYYANILMLYSKPIARVLSGVGGLDVEMIAPSHGVIWRRHVKEIMQAYSEWMVCKPKPKVLVIYDTMWKSTEKMAHAILEGAAKPGVDAKLFYIRASNTTTLATEMLDAATFAFGSPTLNGTLMPQAAAVLTYLKGLKPAGKAGFAFGSYGWAKGGAQEVNEYLEDMKVRILREPIQVQYVPRADDLALCREAGSMLADQALEICKQIKQE
ncbi:MAG: FprA family A-type flavoprotein [Kiritimatiellia bacterium]